MARTCATTAAAQKETGSLSEVEVAALYARREQWEVDREHLLDAELEKAPAPQAGLGYVVAYARPVVPDE